MTGDLDPHFGSAIVALANARAHGDKRVDLYDFYPVRPPAPPRPAPTPESILSALRLAAPRKQ